MKDCTKMVLEGLVERYPALASEKENIQSAFETLVACFAGGNRLYLCGNGGSAADCEHIAGELLKSFKKCRPLPEKLVNALSEYEDGNALISGLEGGLPVVSLCGHIAFSTAYLNDKDPSFIFAQQVNAWGREGDVLLTLSTSGNSKNCVYATMVAKALGMKVVALVGGNGGKLKTLADVAVVAPEKETYKVQEYHLPIYHCLCAMLEEEFF